MREEKSKQETKENGLDTARSKEGKNKEKMKREKAAKRNEDKIKGKTDKAEKEEKK